MERDPLIPRDEAGVARRFQSHREAVRWVFGAVFQWGFRMLPRYVVTMIAVYVWLFFRDNSPDLGFVAIVMIGSPLVLLVSASAVIYAYIALSGGVVGRGERGGSGRTRRGG